MLQWRGRDIGFPEAVAIVDENAVSGSARSISVVRSHILVTVKWHF